MRLRQPSLWAPIGLVVVLAIFPAAFPDELNYIGLGFLTFIFVTLAVAWNMVGGYAGQVSFGYAAFFGTAAYVTAILWSRYQWEPVLTLPLAGLAAVIVSLLVGLPCFRLLGPYFSIATIGVGEAARRGHAGQTNTGHREAGRDLAARTVDDRHLARQVADVQHVAQWIERQTSDLRHAVDGPHQAAGASVDDAQGLTLGQHDVHEAQI